MKDSKYEEALERAKQGLPMDEVFPELKESEDERIRKAISYAIYTATHQDGTLINDVTREEALAYLEKQKEQKPESCDCSRDEESYTNGIHHVLMNPEAYGLIKQKQPEVDFEKFTEKINTFQGRYKYPEIISIKGAMGFMARLFYQYPSVARQWYDSLPKATMD